MDMAWDDVRIFLAVAEAGSVSGAARQLKLAQPTISRRLAEMEEAMGSRLFARGGGGVSGAARQLKLAQPTISRRLAEMEEAMGSRLFARGVGGATLTGAGERLLAPAKNMAEWAGEVARAAEAHDATPQGLVRITA